MTRNATTGAEELECMYECQCQSAEKLRRRLDDEVMTTPSYYQPCQSACHRLPVHRTSTAVTHRHTHITVYQ